MFDISNVVAYERLMVFETPQRHTTPIRDVLGQSRWIDVVGTDHERWCPESPGIPKTPLSIINRHFENITIFASAFFYP
jgi:hypothetical protein